MKRNVYMDMVRQYASAARRLHRSFAPQVHHATEIRVAALKQEFPDPEEHSVLIEKTQKFLQAEYKPWDAEFEPRSYD